MAAALVQLSEGVIVTDAQGRIQYVNAAAARLHGVARVDVGVEDYAATYRLFTEDGRPYPSAELPLARAVLHGETVLDERWRIRRPDGSEILAVGSARPVLDRDGMRIGAVLTLRDDTPRALAVRAERRATEILERVTDAHVAFDRELRYVAVNAAAERSMRRDRESLLGRTLLEVFPDAAGSESMRQYRRVVAEGVEAHFAEHYVGDGLDNHVEVDAYPTDEGGVAVFWREVTARVRAERASRLLNAELEGRNAQLEEQGLALVLAHEELQRTTLELEESERQLRTLADAIPTLAWTARADGFIDWYNARWYEYTGTTPPEMQGWGWQSVHDPAVLPEVLARWTASIATGEQFEMTFPLRGADGRFRPFLTRVSPVRDADGRVVRWFGTNTDVEAEREARARLEAQAIVLAAQTAELEASQDRLRLALDAAAMAYWDFDPATDTTARSAHHDRLYGHASPLPVWNFDIFLEHVHPDDRADTAERFARALHHGEEWRVECRVVWPDGSVHWIAAQGVVSRDALGRAVRVLGIVSDATERKRAEAERERLLRETEHARTEAEAANRAKAEFLAVMSHELRTPLNAIGGYAELIALGIHGPVTAEQQAALERIQRSQRALLSVINEVLNYARLESGAVAYDLTDVPVQEAIDAAEAFVTPQLRARGLAYTFAACDPTLAVRADRDKLQQILLNLLSNAIKFTEPRDGAPGRIEVSCAAGAADPAGTVAIRVRDTGIGIPADKLASVFEPFVQVDVRLTRTQDGTGLGLAISRDLARGMGGDLTAESMPGVGSSFTLTLPRA